VSGSEQISYAAREPQGGNLRSAHLENDDLTDADQERARITRERIDSQFKPSPGKE
jgi:hypothetical protein